VPIIAEIGTIIADAVNDLDYVEQIVATFPGLFWRSTQCHRSEVASGPVGIASRCRCRQRRKRTDCGAT